MVIGAKRFRAPAQSALSPAPAVGFAQSCADGVACGVAGRSLDSEVVEGACGVAFGGRDTMKIVKRPAQRFLNSLADSVGL